MEINFVCEPGADDRDLSLLFRWLRSDPEILRDCSLHLTGSSDEEAMGAADTITAVVSDAVALGSLLVGYFSYRMQYRHRAKAQVKVGDQTIVVSSYDPEQVGDVVAAILAATDSAGPATPGAAGQKQKRKRATT